MSKYSSRFLKLFTLGAVASALALSGCARVASESRGSETHFLDACQSTCYDGLDCLGGLCTRACTNDGICQALNGRASCETAGTTDVCQVVCRDDAECTAVAPGLAGNVARQCALPLQTRMYLACPRSPRRIPMPPRRRECLLPRKHRRHKPSVLPCVQTRQISPSSSRYATSRWVRSSCF
jgi:hypothetical protein